MAERADKMNESIIDMRQVTVDRNTRKNILTVEHFTLRRGELAAVVGPNGAGKSTLLQTVNLLLDYHGDMELFGQDARHTDKTGLRRRSSMVFQDMLLLHDSVYNNIACPLRFRGIHSDEIKHRIKHVLKELRCDHLANRAAHLLSGGETQRVCIARALVTDPELLLLDEHTAALDPATALKILKITTDIVEESQITTMMITNDIKAALSLGNRTIMLDDGEIILDIRGEERDKMTVEELLTYYSNERKKQLSNDRMLLA
jgi:tungstate transport system ATP-binding protein